VIPPHEGARVEIVDTWRKGQQGTFHKVLGQDTLSIDGKNHLSQDHWVVIMDMEYGKKVNKKSQRKKVGFLPRSIKVIPKEKSRTSRLCSWLRKMFS